MTSETSFAMYGAVAPPSAPFHGVMIGVVTRTNDPDRLGRVKLKFPMLADEHESDWVRLAVSMAGNNSGLFFPPKPGDELLVAFAHGDANHPYVLGALWSDLVVPPKTSQDTPDADYPVCVIRSRKGYEISLDDKAGEIMVTAGQKNGPTIKIDCNSGAILIKGESVRIEGEKEVVINGGKVFINCPSKKT